MSGSNHCFLTYIQVSQEAGKVVWYSCLFKNFPQCVVIHTVKGVSVFSEAKVEVFLEFFCSLYDPVSVGNLNSGSSAFLKSSLYICKFSVHIQLKSSLKDFEHYFASLWNECKECSKWKSLSHVWLFAIPMDCTVHGILQARIVKWVAFYFSRGSSQPRDWTKVSHIAGGFFTSWATREAQEYWSE